MTACDGRRLRGVRRIAVLRAGGLGDLLFAVPAMRALAAAYPGAEIALLGSPVAAALFGDRAAGAARDSGSDSGSNRGAGPDRVLVLPPIRGVGAPEDARIDEHEVDRFIAERRAEGYDLAVQLHGGGRYSNPLLLAIGARCTIGTRTPDAAPLDRSIDYVYYQHEMLRGLEVAGLVGAAPVGLEPRIGTTPAEREAATRRFGDADPLAPLVVAHPGASDPRRRWPAERFARVAAELVREGCRVVLVGDGTERELCDGVARMARSELRGDRDAREERVSDASGSLSLSELAGLLACADLVIANDSGPRHLAQAVGARTASVFWFGNLINAGPLSRGRHRVQISWTSHCPVCGRDCTQVGWTSERCEHDVSFVADVSAEAVLADARALLADAQGHDGSCSGQITSSRISQCGGC